MLCSHRTRPQHLVVIHLTSVSTGRRLFRTTKDDDARGRIDEGFEARFPSCHEEPPAVRFTAHSRVSGHRQSQNAGPAGPARQRTLARTLTTAHPIPKRPEVGALL